MFRHTHLLQKEIPRWAKEYVKGPIAEFILDALSGDPNERRKTFPIGKIREHRGFREVHHNNAKHAPYRPVRQLWTHRRVAGFCNWDNNLILKPTA